MIEILKPEFEFTDERGELKQLVHEGYNQLNFVRSNAGTFRGRHCHKLNRETFYVIEGSLEFAARKDGLEERRVFKKDDMFSIDKNVYHDFNFLSDTILLAMYDKGVELKDGEMDIIAE